MSDMAIVTPIAPSNYYISAVPSSNPAGSRRQLMKRVRLNYVVVLWILAIVLLSGLLGLGYEALATSRYRSLGMAGRLIDVGGYKEYIYCLGKGQPTIVFDSGLGDASDVWREIHRQVAEYSRASLTVPD